MQNKQKIKFQILSIFGSVLFEHESVDNTLKETVEKAVENRASLNGASLNGASLNGANLNGANLNGANLYGANLYGANLNGASLNGASLNGANLYGANLYGANNLNSIYVSDLYSLKLLPKDTILTYWKYLKDGKSPYQGKEYLVGKTYTEKDFNTDEREQCGSGLNVATLQWCLKDSGSNAELIEVQFKVSDIIAIPYFTDGKFRVKKFKVLRKITKEQAEKLLKDITKL